MDGPSFVNEFTRESDDSFGTEQETSPEILGLGKLSSSMEKLITDSNYDFNDAHVVVEGVEVGIIRGILAARSPFFFNLFKEGNGEVGIGGRPRYLMSKLVPDGFVGYEAFKAILSYIYSGKLVACPVEVSTCVDDTCSHDSCRPAIDYVVELMHASVKFQMQELVMLFKRRLLSFIAKALIEDVIPITVVASKCKLELLLSHSMQRLVESKLDNIYLEKELPPDVSNKIRVLRINSQREFHLNAAGLDPGHEKKISNIHKAVALGDTDLFKLLLVETGLSLDDTFALHYATAYCEPEVVKGLLNLNMATINCRNSLGYTVLHVAARRKDPSIIMALLTSGACASETTTGEERHTAVTICRRLTRPKDFYENIVQGKDANKDRLCIALLEKGQCTNSNPSTDLPTLMDDDDLEREVKDLENRVRIARILFPHEAKLAIENAIHSLPNFNYARPSLSKGLFESLSQIHLNESSEMKTRRLMLKLAGLMKTVETGRCYFPYSSEVIDKIMTVDFLLLDSGTSEERRLRKRRYMEIKEDMQRAFDKDTADTNYDKKSPSSKGTSSSPGK